MPDEVRCTQDNLPFGSFRVSWSGPFLTTTKVPSPLPHKGTDSWAQPGAGDPGVILTFCLLQMYISGSLKTLQIEGGKVKTNRTGRHLFFLYRNSIPLSILLLLLVHDIQKGLISSLFFSVKCTWNVAVSYSPCISEADSVGNTNFYD